MAQRKDGVALCRELLDQWAARKFADPLPEIPTQPPTTLLDLARDLVRRAVAARLQTVSEHEDIDPKEIARLTVEAVCQGLSPGKTKAFSALVRRAADEVLIEHPPAEMTRRLWVWAESPDSQSNREELFKMLYAELYHLAAKKLSSKELRYKLSPAELVSELYLKLAQWEATRLWANRRQFFAMVSTVLENVLFDVLKASGRQRRFKSQLKVPLDGVERGVSAIHVDTIDSRNAMKKLNEIDPALAEIVRLRVYREWTHGQIAEFLGSPEITVKRRYRRALVVLREILDGSG